MNTEPTDPALAFLDSAKFFDTVSLARSTEKALEIIMPWCEIRNSSELGITKDMQTQALIYAKAINSSVGAAHLGFSVCEDALALVECIPETTAENRKEFLEGVKMLTLKGYAKAVEAKQGFIHVRTTVEELLKKMKIENPDSKVEYRDSFSNVIRKPFSEVQSQLCKGIHDLEQFSEILSKFAAWWNEIAMETNTQLRRENAILKQFDKLHLLAIERRWKEHKGRYAAYVNEIGIVQDRYPNLFDETKSAFPTTQYDPPPGPLPVFTPMNDQAEASYLRPERTEPHNTDDWRFMPGHQNRPQPVRAPNSVIISEELSSTSYMSASLATVQALEPNKCLIILQFQCHPSPSRRFSSLRIKWRLKTVRGAHPSKIIDVAPRYAIGARNEESHQRKFSITVPAQFNMGGVNAGPEVNAEWQLRKKLAHAMIITGSVRGHGQDSAEWTLEENASAMTGIPPYFCIAAVVQYEGILMIELNVLAKQRGIASWWSSRNQVKEDFVVDIDQALRAFEEYKPSRNWRTWFPLFSGEVMGGAGVVHPQETVTRN